jgi:hypothetical protein
MCIEIRTVVNAKRYKVNKNRDKCNHKIKANIEVSMIKAKDTTNYYKQMKMSKKSSTSQQNKVADNQQKRFVTLIGDYY